jgi:hypothetical protein
VSERLHTAAALVRLRKQQRDAAAAHLAVAIRRQVQLDDTARGREQLAAAVESQCLAQFRTGSELDPGLHAHALDALAATTLAAEHARDLATQAARGSEAARAAVTRQEVFRHVAVNWQERLQKEQRRVTDTREVSASIEAQNARLQQDVNP